jgi:hypothetical protein
MLWTVVNVSGWSEPRARSLSGKRSPIPLQGIVVLSLVVEHRSHVVDGGQRGRVVRSQGPLLSGKRSPIPLEGIVVLSLADEHRSHAVDGGQRGRVVRAQSQLSNTEAMLWTVVNVEGWSIVVSQGQRGRVAPARKAKQLADTTVVEGIVVRTSLVS